MRILAMIGFTFCLNCTLAQTGKMKVSHFGVREGLRNPGVNCLSKDSRGFLWIGSTVGLTRFDGVHFRTFSMPEGGEGSFVYAPRCMVVDSRDCIWMGTKRGLFCFNTSTETFAPFRSKELTDTTFVRTLGLDSSGHIWAGTDKRHFCINPHKDTCIEVKNAATSDSIHASIRKMYTEASELIKQNQIYNVTALQPVSDGGWWIGTFFDGLYYVQPDNTPFNTITNTDGNRDLMIVRQIAVLNNQMYVGTENMGLKVVVNNADGTTTLQSVPLMWNNKSLGTNTQAVMVVGQELWIGMAAGGIYVFQPKTGQIIHHYTANDKDCGLADDDIVCMLQTRRGDVLVGTKSGLMVKSKDDNKFTQPKGMDQGMVHALAEFDDGTVWVGRLEKPMLLMQKSNDGSWSVRDAGFFHPCVTSLLIDNKGNLWIGTDCKGVWKRNAEGAFEQSPLSYDILHSSANTLLFDDDGILWVSTTNGLFSYDDANIRIQHFTSDTDGLPSDQMSFFSGYKAGDGHLYMGTYRGLVKFMPSKLRTKLVLLKPYFTNVCIGENDTLAQQKLILEYNSPSIRIDYAVPNIPRSQKIWCRYRLEGASQDDWTMLQSTEQSIYISHLSPGSYTLQLQASQDPNNWDEQMQTDMNIRVNPPFWLSRWGIGLYIIIFVVIIYLLLDRWRHRIERRNLREQVANLLQNQELMRNTQATSPYDLIKDITRNKTDNRLMKQIDDILEQNTRNPQMQVDLLADLLNMSKSTLYRRMKEITSITPNEYIRLFRLKKAAHLLREEGMSIRQVSEELCFSSVAYFTNCFSKQFGITPGEYAKN